MARTRMSSSLPRPTRYLGSGSGRRCSTTPATTMPAVRHSSRSSATRLDRATPVLARGRLPGLDHHQQRPLGAAGGDGRGDRPLELLLQRGDQLGDVQLGAVEGDRRQDRPGWRSSPGRQQVGHVQVGGAAVAGDPHGGHQVQPQQRQVDQVVAGERLVAQVGVHQAQAPEAARGRRAGGRTRAGRCARRPPRRRARSSPRRLASSPTCRSSSRERPHM